MSAMRLDINIISIIWNCCEASSFSLKRLLFYYFICKERQVELRDASVVVALSPYCFLLLRGNDFA